MLLGYATRAPPPLQSEDQSEDFSSNNFDQTIISSFSGALKAHHLMFIFQKINGGMPLRPQAGMTALVSKLNDFSYI